MDEDPLVFWRHASDLSVIDAAILMAGGHPGETETVENELGDFETVKKTTGYPKYRGAFAMLTGAILNDRLKARLAYAATVGDVDPLLFGRDCWFISGHELGRLFAKDKRDRIEAYQVLEIQREPDWSRSLVAVEDLKVWLQTRGITKGFFFPVPEAAPRDFLDPAHEHFSPELALAVATWLALERRHEFPRGVKAAIDEYIAAHPQAWQGPEPLTDKAKERIAVLINWNPRGGAPRTETRNLALRGGTQPPKKKPRPPLVHSGKQGPSRP